MAKYWLVEVSYPGYEPGLDDKLEAYVGRPRSGSGASFGKCDMDWTFDTEEEARVVTAKLRTYAVENSHWQLAVGVTEHDDEE